MIMHKRLFLITALAITIQGLGGCVHNNGKTESDENIVAHWTFDSAAGSIIEDAAGYHNGTLRGAVGKGFLRKGLYGNAALFNKGRNYVSIPHSDALSLVDNFAIECVIKPFNVKGFKTIIWKGYRKTSPEEINYCVDIRDGKVELKTKDKEGKWTVYSTSKPVLEVNKWYDLIITYKHGRVDIYVNGVKYPARVSENKPSQSFLLANKDDVTIGVGANHLEPSYFFDGLIDDIKISKGVKVDISRIKQECFFQKIFKNQMTSLENNAAETLSITKKMKAMMENDRTHNPQKNQNISDALSAVCATWLATNESLIKEIRKQINLMEYKKYYTACFSKNQPFALTVFPAYKRLLKQTRFFKRIKFPQNRINLCLSRNEHEGFQAILLGNPFSDVNNVNVNVEDLKHENGKDIISSENIEWGPVASIETTPPEIAVDFVGKIPDVIMEGKERIDIAKNDFTPVFFRIFASRKTIPGNYKGKIKFSYGKCVEELELNVKVYDFTLPERNSLIVAFSFFESFYLKWYGYKRLTDKQKIYIYKFLLKYRIPPCHIYSSEKCYPNIKFLETLADKGANFCTINSGSRTKDISKKVAALQSVIGKLKEKGFYKYTYFYSFDELGVHMKNFPRAKALLPAIHKAYPDLRLMQTSFPNPKIAPLFNVWVPMFTYFTSEENMKILGEMRKKPNAEIWWYNADFPRHPYPNYFLDYPLFDCRVIMSLSYMYKVKGILYWCINREWKTNNVKGKKWPDISWKPYIFSASTGKRKNVNGMGNFLYPGANGRIYPSLRLENFRDGIEDYEYYKLLERRLAYVKKNNPYNALIKEAEKLLKIPPNVAVAVNYYSSDPTHLIAHRKKVAEMIVRLQMKNRKSVNDKQN